MQKSDLNLPTVEQSHIIFEKNFFKIRCDTLVLTNGQSYPYYTLIAKPFAVAVLVYASDGSYYFNKEYRHPTGKVLLSCPGGFIEDNETPIEAAKRELLEETGLEAESFVVIGVAYPYAGISSQKTYFVRAVGAKPHSTPKLEQAEIIQTVKLTKFELSQEITKGIDLDGQLCSALFFDSYNQ